MLIEELVTMVHQNAVEHGWWEEDRPITEVVALIHSEWSEALEEARAGRPLVWYACGEAEHHTLPCNPKDEYECRMYGRENECQYRGKKPEGVAVELIDGIIRILDLFGKEGVTCTDPYTGRPSTFESLWGDSSIDCDLPNSVADLVCTLHTGTSEIFNDESYGDPTALVAVMSMALMWIHRNGLDPLEVIKLKHQYNKTRPYKHGKKF